MRKRSKLQKKENALQRQDTVDKYKITKTQWKGITKPDRSAPVFTGPAG